MTQRVAFKCNIWSKKGVSMYRFPKDPKIRRIWIRNLRRDGFKVTEYSKLCARHFTPDQFTTHHALPKGADIRSWIFAHSVRPPDRES